MKNFLVISFFLLSYVSAYNQELNRYKELPDTLLSSKFLPFKKKLKVFLPREFRNNASDPFPLIIVFDSQNQRNFRYILSTIDYLTAGAQIPPSVVLGIESEDSHRLSETTLPATNKDRLGGQNEHFIMKELIAFAQKNYHVSGFNILIGHSAYGYFTTYLLSQYPKELYAVISASPNLITSKVNLVDSIQRLQKRSLPHKIYYRYSTGHEKGMSAGRKVMDSCLSLHQNNLLDHKSFSFPDADHNITPGLTILPSLYEIFARWVDIQEDFLKDNTDTKYALSKARQKISGHYGITLPLSLNYLNGRAWQLYNEKKYIEAISNWKEILKLYPQFSEAYLGIISSEKGLGKSLKETSLLFSKGLLESAFYTEAQKIELTNEFEELMK